MAKRRYWLDEKKISRYQKEGRGTGHGAEYTPWLKIQDVPSRGRSSRIHSYKTNRAHHLLSDLETGLFLLLDWSDRVVDIREQYPLDRDMTRDIAREAGVRHPADTSSQVDVVMTTDFLVDVLEADGTHERAYAVKPASGLENKRTIEKFEIERRYWQQRGIIWQLVTDLDLPKERIKTLHWLHEMQSLERLEAPHADYWQDRCERLVAALGSSGSGTVQQFVAALENSAEFSAGEPMTVIRHLAANKVIAFDLDEGFSGQWPISKLRLTTQGTTRRRA